MRERPHTTRCVMATAVMLATAITLGAGTRPGTVAAADEPAAQGELVSIAAGTGHTCAILDNHTVKCWGYGYSGQLGNGRRTLKCWGDNSSGQLGNGRGTRRIGDQAAEMGDNLPDRRTSAQAAQHSPSPPATAYTCALLDNHTRQVLGIRHLRAARQRPRHPFDRQPGGRDGRQPPRRRPRHRTNRTRHHRRCMAHLRTPRQPHAQVLGRRLLRAARQRPRHHSDRGPGGRDGRQPPRRRPRHRPHSTRHHLRLQPHLRTPRQPHASSAGDTAPTGSSATDAAPHGSETRRPRWATTSPPSTSAPDEPHSPSPPATTHTCALLDNHTLKCWGFGSYGQLGNGRGTRRVGNQPGEMGDNLHPIRLGTGRTVAGP